jgi:hypothetical protein
MAARRPTPVHAMLGTQSESHSADYDVEPGIA